MSSTHKQRSFPFPLIFLGSLFALSFVLFFLWNSVVNVSDQDFEEYHNLMAEANPTLSDKSQKAPYTAIQKQKGVQKDIYFYRGPERHHLLLVCSHIDAILNYRHGKTDLTEVLKDVKGCVQDTLESDEKTNELSQKIYSVSASEVSLNYQNQSFVAQGVRLIDRLLPGHQLDSKHVDFADQKSLSIELLADHADYQAGQMALNGNVVLKSPVATVQAETATAGMLLVPKKSGMFDEISLKGNVRIDYQGKLNIFSDRATYIKNLEGFGAHSFRQLPGNIILEGAGPDEKCRVVNAEGDELYAPKIAIDTNEKSIFVEQPLGFMHLDAVSKGQRQPLRIKADALHWDLTRDCATLKGAIEINQEDWGFMDCDGEAAAYYSGGQGKKRLMALTAEGHTVLCKIEPYQSNCHWLICEGKMVIDHEKMEAELTSPKDAQDKVIFGKQVFIYDQMGEVQGDKMIVTYQHIDGKLAATKVSLEGNVYMIDHNAPEGEDRDDPLHYALADKAEYSPMTRQVYLSSYPGHRVLFYDKVNDLQVSAPALKITRDEQTKKEKIQGEGDVRFHFIHGELDLFQKRTALNF